MCNGEPSGVARRPHAASRSQCEIKTLYRPRLRIPSIPRDRLPARCIRPTEPVRAESTCLTLDSRVRSGRLGRPAPTSHRATLRADGRPGAGRDASSSKLSRQGEEALGKIAEELIANPVVNGAITRAFEAREKARAGPGGRDGRAQPPLGRRHRAPHPPAALALAAPRGHRGRDRPARGAARPAVGAPAPTGIGARSRSASTRSPATWPRCARPWRPSDEPGAARAGAPDGHRVVAASARAVAAQLAAAVTPRSRPRRAAGRSPRAARRRPAARRRAGTSVTAEHAGRRARRAAPRPAGSSAASISTAARAALDATRRLALARVVEEVGADHGRRAARRPPTSRCEQPGVGAERAVGAQRRARAVGRQHALGGHQVAQLEVVGRARRRCRSGPGGARRARSAPRPRSPRSARPCRWTGSVSGSPSAATPGVAPQPAVVVEHLRAVEQRLGHGERAVGVAGQQHALGEVGGRAQVDRRRISCRHGGQG